MLHPPLPLPTPSPLLPQQSERDLHRRLWQLRELGIAYRIHADDLGLTPAISGHILESHDQGALQSASLIVNGADAAAAAEQARRRPALGLHLHWNLTEGPPVAPRHEVPLLVGADGQLNVSFERLVTLSLRAPASALRAQLAAELRAQRRRFVELTGHTEVRLDSHNHVHVLPAAFDAVMEVHAELPWAYVRLPREPWLWLPERAGAYLGLGPVKHALLNGLIRRGRYAERLAAAGIATCDVFIGVLFTGQMDGAVVTAALPECFAALGEVELLFHPGQAAAGEVDQWDDRPSLANYYTSPARLREKAALLG